MVTISEAQEQINKQRQEVQLAREQIEQQNRIAEENKRILAESKKRLPDVSTQKALRNLYGGLQGIQKRKTIESLKSDITTKEQLLEQAKQEISKSSSYVSDYEQQLNKYQQDVNAVREQAQALETVKKFADKGDLAYLAMYGEGLEKEYALELVKLQDVEQQNWLRDVKKYQASLPEGEKLQIDIGKMKITGVESSAFGKSMNLDEYNKKIEALQKSAGSMQEKIGVAIPLLDVKEIPVNNFDRLATGFGTVSATGMSIQEIPQEQKDGVISKSLQKVGEVYTGIKTKASNIYSYDILGGRGKGELSLKKFINPMEEYTEEGKVKVYGGSPFAYLPIFPASTNIPKKLTLWEGQPNKVPEFIEIQKPVNVFGKQTTASVYKLETETSPAKVVLKNLKGEGLLFSEPKFVPPKFETTLAPRVIGDLPFKTYTTKLGEVVKLNKLSGQSIPTTLEEFNSLSKTQQYTWQRMAEEITGRPVSIQNVPRVLSQNKEYALGYLEQVNLGRYNLKNYKVTPAKLGKTTSRYETTSAFRKVGETNKVEYYKGNIYFKDITKPFSRATGKIPSMKGTIIRYKEPLIIGEDSNVNFIKPANIKKTPLSKTFGNQVQQLENEFNLLKGKDILVTSKPFPRVVRTRQKIIYTKGGLNKYGKFGLATGLSNRQIGSILDKQPIGNIVGDIVSGQRVGREENLFGKEFAQAKEETREESKQLEYLSQPNKEIEKINLKSIEILKPKETDRVINKPVEVLKPVELLKPKEVQIIKQKQSQTQKTKQPIKYKVPTKPKVPIPKKPIIFKFPKSSKLKISKKEEEEFGATGIRFGKEIKLAKGSKEKVSKELTSFLKKGLGASGYLTKGTEKIKAEETDLLKDFEFTKSKINPYKIVERKEKRLRTGTTGKEVQIFRNNKKSKSIF